MGCVVTSSVVGRWLVVTRVHCGQMMHPRPIVTMEHYYPRNLMVQSNRGMGPPWGAFCQITLTSCSVCSVWLHVSVLLHVNYTISYRIVIAFSFQICTTTVNHRAVTACADLQTHDHITPELAQLHWLPVQFSIKFRLCLLMHQIHVGRCPIYLAELVSSSAENCRRPGLRSTRSSVYMYVWVWWWWQRWADKWTRGWVETWLARVTEWIWDLIPETWPHCTLRVHWLWVRVWVQVIFTGIQRHCRQYWGDFSANNLHSILGKYDF